MTLSQVQSQIQARQERYKKEDRCITTSIVSKSKPGYYLVLDREPNRWWNKFLPMVMSLDMIRPGIDFIDVTPEDLLLEDFDISETDWDDF